MIIIIKTKQNKNTKRVNRRLGLVNIPFSPSLSRASLQGSHRNVPSIQFKKKKKETWRGGFCLAAVYLRFRGKSHHANLALKISQSLFCSTACFGIRLEALAPSCCCPIHVPAHVTISNNPLTIMQCEDQKSSSLEPAGVKKNVV